MRTSHCYSECCVCSCSKLPKSLQMLRVQWYLPAPQIVKSPLTKSIGSSGMLNGRHLFTSDKNTFTNWNCHAGIKWTHRHQMCGQCNLVSTNLG